METQLVTRVHIRGVKKLSLFFGSESLQFIERFPVGWLFVVLSLNWTVEGLRFQVIQLMI